MSLSSYPSAILLHHLLQSFILNGTDSPLIRYVARTENMFFDGVYFPLLVKDSTTWAAGLDADIYLMENSSWIDTDTAMVEVACIIWNPNNNLQGNVRASHGRVHKRRLSQPDEAGIYCGSLQVSSCR